MVFPDEVRELALEHYVEHGAPGTRAILLEHGHDVSTATIRQWASRAGLNQVRKDQLVVLREIKQAELAVEHEKWELKRVRIGDRIGEVAEQMINAIERAIAEDKISKARDGATAMAVLVDKAQLLTGGATRRNESVSRDVLAQRAAELDELSKRRAASG